MAIGPKGVAGSHLRLGISAMQTCTLGNAMNTVSRRRALKIFGLTAASSVLLETRMVANAQEASFTWASIGGTWAEAVKKTFVDGVDFSAKTNLRVSNAANLDSVTVAKVMSSCGNPPYDVASGSGLDYVLLSDAKCLEPYDPSIVTNLSDIYPNAREGNFFAPFSINLLGLTWNTRETQEPTSFQDLWKPAYRGRVGVPAFGWYGMVWLHAVNKELGGNEDNIEPGLTAIADLVKKNNAVIIENVDQGFKLLQRGEVVMMPYLDGRTLRLKDAGVPVKFAFPKGTAILGNGFSIPKGGKNLRAAQQFVNNTLDPQLQVEFAKWSKYPPSNRKAVLPPELASIAIPEANLERGAHLNWSKVNQRRAEYLSLWNKRVLS